MERFDQTELPAPDAEPSPVHRHEEIRLHDLSPEALRRVGRTVLSELGEPDHLANEIEARTVFGGER